MTVPGNQSTVGRPALRDILMSIIPNGMEIALKQEWDRITPPIPRDLRMEAWDRRRLGRAARDSRQVTGRPITVTKPRLGRQRIIEAAGTRAFSIQQAFEWTGLDRQALRQSCAQMIENGHAVRIVPGVFQIVDVEGAMQEAQGVNRYQAVSDRQQEMLAMMADGPVSAKQLMKRFEMSEKSVRNDLNALFYDEKIVKLGSRTHRMYALVREDGECRSRNTQRASQSPDMSC